MFHAVGNAIGSGQRSRHCRGSRHTLLGAKSVDVYRCVLRRNGLFRDETWEYDVLCVVG